MSEHFDMAYGNGTLPLNIADNLEPIVLLPGKSEAICQPLEAVRAALDNPTGTSSLSSLLKSRKPKKIVIVVNDETRPTPYKVLLPPLLENLSQAGISDEQITFLIATGIHAPHSAELNERIFGADICNRFNVISHVSTDDSMLVHLGKTPSGYDLEINKLALEADFLITLGVVMPHYFAGYSGGRKSILPGLASKKTVACNHARMVEIVDSLPPIDDNPISKEMIWAARKVGVDFILNAVTNASGEIVKVVAGDLEKAWREAVSASAAIYEVPVKEQVDICVASACGYPRDVNMYQAQKALDHADRITREGGTIILVAEARDGFGETIFEDWMRKGLTPTEIMERIRKNFVIGAHKAYGFAKVANRAKILMVTQMSEKDVHALFASKAASLQKTFDEILHKNPGATVAILPFGSLTLPVVSAMK